MEAQESGDSGVGVSMHVVGPSLEDFWPHQRFLGDPWKVVTMAAHIPISVHVRHQLDVVPVSASRSRGCCVTLRAPKCQGSEEKAPRFGRLNSVSNEIYVKFWNFFYNNRSHGFTVVKLQFCWTVLAISITILFPQSANNIWYRLCTIINCCCHVALMLSLAVKKAQWFMWCT